MGENNLALATFRGMNRTDEWDITMSKKDKTAKMASENNDATEGDSDFHEEPEQLADNDADEEEFEFDPALMLKGVELVDLTPDFVRPEGFLMVPRMNRKTGEIFPKSTTFAGILKDVIPWKDNRGKERVWFSCIATSAVEGTCYTGRDNDGKPFVEPVQKGDCIGISGSGAINALKTKKGHFVLLHWTGSKVSVKNGDMWEVIAKVSKEPVQNPPF